MKQDTNNDIKDACTALADAVAQLITAVTMSARSAAAEPNWSIKAGGDTEAALSCFVAAGEVPKSTRRVFVYCAGSRGLADLAQVSGSKIMAAMGIPAAPYIVKCGTTVVDLPTRLAQIAKDRYGAAIRTDKGIEFQPGYDAWIAHAIATSRRPRDAAIALLPRAVSVALPTGMTRRAFDAALHRALKARALDGLPAKVMAKRLVAYDLISTRVSVAKELYAVCPHNPRDGDMLLTAIETALTGFRSRRT